MAVPAANTYIQQIGVNAATGVVTAIVGSLIIGGLLALIARRAQFRREDRMIRDRLIEEITRTLGTLNIKLQLYEHFVIAPVDDVSRSPDELAQRRSDLDIAYESAAATANSLESRLRAYFEDTTVAEAWHGAWDCLVVRYYSMIVPGRASQEKLYKENAGEEHSGLSVTELADPAAVRRRYQVLRNEVTEALATSQLRI